MYDMCFDNTDNSKRIQANWYLEPVHISPTNVWFSKLVPAHYPVAWFEQTGSQLSTRLSHLKRTNPRPFCVGSITPDLASKFKSKVYDAEHAAKLVKYLGWVIGIVLLNIGILTMCRVFCWTPAPEYAAADYTYADDAAGDDIHTLNGDYRPIRGSGYSSNASSSAQRSIKESYGAGVEEAEPESDLLAKYMGHAQPIDATTSIIGITGGSGNGYNGNGHTNDMTGGVAVTVGGGHSGDSLVSPSL
jgi:ABC-type cobalt transport system substrate-binding protein